MAGFSWSGGADFGLKNGEELIVFDVPMETKFTIEEEDDGLNSYKTEITVDGEKTEGKKYSGVTKKETTIAVTYTNTFHYQLPETGGPGTTLYTLAALPTLLAAGLLYKRSRKKGGTVS